MSKNSDETKVPIQIGDWVVQMSRFTAIVLLAEDVSDKCFWAKSDGSRRTSRLSRETVVFAGPKDLADKLAERLISSRAQQTEDERAAYYRRIDRDKKFVEAAQKVAADWRDKRAA